LAQPFDTTLKHLLESHPADCLRLVGLATEAPIDVIDADLATVIAEADKVFRVNEPLPWLMHFELQASYDAELPQRMLRYNVLLRNRHGLPVRSVAILLRPKADGPEMTGVVRHTVGAEQYLEFRYRVVRIWQQPVEAILAAGVGTLPLAPLADVHEPELPGVIGQMKERMRAEVKPSEEAQLWTATYVLMGLRYDKALARELLKGVREMEESVTYQAIIQKGKAEGKIEGKIEGAAEEAQRILLLVGTKAFGQPDAATQTAIAALLDRERLESLIERVGEVTTWQELLGKPRPQRRNGGKRKR
jgi:predicted transposase YdaD